MHNDLYFLIKGASGENGFPFSFSSDKLSFFKSEIICMNNILVDMALMMSLKLLNSWFDWDAFWKWNFMLRTQMSGVILTGKFPIVVLQVILQSQL